MAWRGSVAYMSDNAVAVTNAAHAKGVRVVPTFQLFDSGSLPKMKAFLGSTAAQDRFIAQALDLMARRSADGANFDFEPMPASMTPRYLAFLARFNTAMDARFPDATLVNASSAGAPSALITGLVPIVDQQFVMTYNYRWSGSTVTGAIAPLDHASRNVKIHMKRFMAYAPKESLILGRAVLRLRLAGDEHRPERDGAGRQGEVRRGQVGDVRLGADVPRRPSRRRPLLRRARGQQLLLLLGRVPR